MVDGGSYNYWYDDIILTLLPPLLSLSLSLSVCVARSFSACLPACLPPPIPPSPPCVQLLSSGSSVAYSIVHFNISVDTPVRYPGSTQNFV